MSDEDDDWEKVWDARLEAMKPILGESGSEVYHAMLPFQFGGQADVVPFPNYLPGSTYVTAELSGEETGQLSSKLGNYELMICTKKKLDQAANFISSLARYTCEAVLEVGETMSIGDYFQDKTIRGMLFALPADEPVHFNLMGKKYGLLLCIGVTEEEVEFANANGAEKLLSLLKKHSIFPYTVPNRRTVPLE